VPAFHGSIVIDGVSPVGIVSPGIASGAAMSKTPSVTRLAAVPSCHTSPRQRLLDRDQSSDECHPRDAHHPEREERRHQRPTAADTPGAVSCASAPMLRPPASPLRHEPRRNPADCGTWRGMRSSDRRRRAACSRRAGARHAWPNGLGRVAGDGRTRSRHLPDRRGLLVRRCRPCAASRGARALQPRASRADPTRPGLRARGTSRHRTKPHWNDRRRLPLGCGPL
jgi:hypothetical protein